MVVASSQMTNLSPFEFRVVFAKEQFFWGHVEYNDIFKIKRTARFCAVIVPSEHTVAGKYQLAGEAGWRECDWGQTMRRYHCCAQKPAT